MQKPGKMLLSGPAGEKKLGAPATRSECTDRAQTSTNVSGRPSRVDLRSVLPKSARTKGYVGKRTKADKHNYTYTRALPGTVLSETGSIP